MPPPIAYFLTWTTKGSWLHGDVRGSVNKVQNQVGTAKVAPSPRTEQREVAQVGHDGVVLTSEMRGVVHTTIEQHCAVRGWRIKALNVRTQHVHLVVADAHEYAPDKVFAELKAWCTRRLRDAKLVDPELKLWTTHASTRWINDEDSLGRAIHYVLHEQ